MPAHLTCSLTALVGSTGHPPFSAPRAMAAPPPFPFVDAHFLDAAMELLEHAGNQIPAELVTFFDQPMGVAEHAVTLLSDVRCFRIPVHVDWPELGYVMRALL